MESEQHQLLHGDEVQSKLTNWLNLASGQPDFVVHVEHFHIPCHKEVLRKSSCYFEALFTSQMKEAESDTLTLKNTEPEIMLVLLDFAYTGRLNINEENMFQVASLSSMYQFPSALKISQDYIACNVSSETWLEILLFSEMHHLKTAYHAALRYIFWKFPQEIQVNIKKFNQLSKELLTKILGHSLLNCDSEVDVFQVVENWIQHNTDQTNEKCSELIQSTVYFDDMTCSELEKIMESASATKYDELRQIIDEKMKHFESRKTEATENINHSMGNKTSCRRGPMLMLCVGGDNIQREATLPSKWIYQVEPFTAEVDKFRTLDEVFSRFETKMGYRACTVGTDLYIMGGEASLGRNKFLLDVWRYSSFGDKWQLKTCVTQPRRHHGIAVLGDSIFLIGGIGKYRQILTSVESYNTVTDEWINRSPLPEPEFWPAVAVCRGEIYCVKNIQQKYSPVTDQWTTLRVNLPFNLGFHNAVCVGESVYMKCQYDGRMVRLRTNPDLKAETVATFSSAPEGQLLAFRDRIYCFAGEDCTQLQYYDVRSEQVKTVGDMDLPLTGSSLVLFPHYPEQL